MAKIHRNSVDGFIPRQPTRNVNREHGHEVGPTPPTFREITASTKPVRNEKRATLGVSQMEIDESLKGINIGRDEPSIRKPRHRDPAQKSRRRKIIKWILIALLLVGLGIGGYIGIKVLLAGGNVFKGNMNLFDFIQEQPLKMDKSGRTNILILGTSDDDPGHEASYLTDSIMVLSVDQNAKNAFMVSIPRDLNVKYGQACTAGYQGKINVYFSCVGGDPKNLESTRTALDKTGKFIGGIVGLDIQYGVNLNYTVMRDLVKAVGGSITVTIESRDERGQMDSNFDWKCGVGDRKVTRAQVLKRCPPSGHFIDYPNGPAVLDAEHALYLAQARGDTAPTYGFEKSNFDREKNQQKIIKALREKAVSAGVVTDFTKVTGIIDALGNNLRTTFEAKDFRRLVSLTKDIKSDDIKSISLNEGDQPIMDGTGNPVAGQFDYSELRALIKKNLSNDPVEREAAVVSVYNGSGVAGKAQAEANKLDQKGFTTGAIGNAPVGDYGTYAIYQIGEGNSGTAAKLAELYGVTIQKTKPPVTTTGETKFVLIIGKQPAAASTPEGQ